METDLKLHQSSGSLRYVDQSDFDIRFYHFCVYFLRHSSISHWPCTGIETMFRPKFGSNKVIFSPMTKLGPSQPGFWNAVRCWSKDRDGIRHRQHHGPASWRNSWDKIRSWHKRRWLKRIYRLQLNENVQHETEAFTTISIISSYSKDRHDACH